MLVPELDNGNVPADRRPLYLIVGATHTAIYCTVRRAQHLIGHMERPHEQRDEVVSLGEEEGEPAAIDTY